MTLRSAQLRPAGGEGEDIVRLTARAFERDRYLTALLAPRTVRDDLVAMAAFGGDLERIRATVREPMMAAVRLQWWRDEIERAASEDGGRSGYPIADRLVAAIGTRGLSEADLIGLVDACEDAIAPQPFLSMADLERHLVAREGAAMRLAHQVIAGRTASGDEGAFLDAAGVAYGLARVLAEAPAELAEGRCLIPADMLAAHGSSRETIASAAGRAVWRALNSELRGRIATRLGQVAERFHAMPAAVRAAALPVALVRPYLSASERIEIADLVAADIGPLVRVWRLWRAHRTGRV